MKLTLKQKRTIITKFKVGVSINDIYLKYSPGWADELDIIDCIRDYINGKFHLPKKGK